MALRATLDRPASCLITENGIADADDSRRKHNSSSKTCIAVQKAVESGVNLHGYFHWSAFDNCGVGAGAWVQSAFGLYAIDFRDKRAHACAMSAKAYIDCNCNVAGPLPIKIIERGSGDQKKAVAI